VPSAFGTKRPPVQIAPRYEEVQIVCPRFVRGISPLSMARHAQDRQDSALLERIGFKDDLADETAVS